MGIRNVASGLIGLVLAGGLTWGGLSPGTAGARPAPLAWALTPDNGALAAWALAPDAGSLVGSAGNLVGDAGFLVDDAGSLVDDAGSLVDDATPTADAGGLEFRWPRDGPVAVVKAFDRPAQPWLAGHRGVDLAADAGESVRAPSGGVVTYVGYVVDRHLVVIDHGSLRSTLEPVSSSLAAGDRVGAGAVVGTVTREAAHTANSLHWGVRLPDGTYIDPAALVRPRPRAVLLE